MNHLWFHQVPTLSVSVTFISFKIVGTVDEIVGSDNNTLYQDIEKHSTWPRLGYTNSRDFVCEANRFIGQICETYLKEIRIRRLRSKSWQKCPLLNFISIVAALPNIGISVSCLNSLFLQFRALERQLFSSTMRRVKRKCFLAPTVFLWSLVFLVSVWLIVSLLCLLNFESNFFKFKRNSLKNKLRKITLWTRERRNFFITCDLVPHFWSHWVHSKSISLVLFSSLGVEWQGPVSFDQGNKL